MVPVGARHLQLWLIDAIQSSNVYWCCQPVEKGEIYYLLWLGENGTHETLADLISVCCRVCCEARLMPSQRSLSLVVQAGGGTNWWTLELPGLRWTRRDAKSSLWTSGTLLVSTSCSPSEEESQAGLWELKNSFSERRMMFGDGDLASFSSVIAVLGVAEGTVDMFREQNIPPITWINQQQEHAGYLGQSYWLVSLHKIRNQPKQEAFNSTPNHLL